MKLFDELVGYLNNLRAGDVLLFLAVIGWAGVKLITYLRKIAQMHKEAVAEDINKDTEYENLIKGLADTQEELSVLKERFTSRFKAVEKVLDEEHTKSEGGDEQLTEALTELQKTTKKHSEHITSIEKSLRHIQEQIELLFRSDNEYFRAYIIDGYNKYVKEEHEIPLIALQTFESIYNKYLNENESDEFVARMMKELRNLPTSSHDV